MEIEKTRTRKNHKKVFSLNYRVLFGLSIHVETTTMETMKMSSAIRRVVTLVFGTALALVISTPVWAASYSITILDTGFMPNTLTVQVGDTLEFRNSSSSTQSARTSLSSGFITGDIGVQQAKTVVVNNPGVYNFYSQYNQSLTGIVTVASASATTSGTTTTTTTSTINSQPVQTQAQPVSGAFEVFLAVIATGTAFLGFGWFSQRRLAFNQLENSEVIQLPSIRVTVEKTDESDRA